LKKDPAGVYEKMDYKSKEYYRNKIKELSEETKISEVYIANKCLDLALNVSFHETFNAKQTHIGYYLISDGIDELRKEIVGAADLSRPGTCGQVPMQHRVGKYILYNFILTAILSTLFGAYIYRECMNAAVSIITFILIFIPVSEICIQLINYILSKKVKPKLIPKLDFSGGIPEEAAAFVIIPTLIKSKEKVKELIKKLEVYYLANKSDNIYFALLGDCSECKNEEEDFDEEIIETGLQEIEKLNTKYDTETWKSPLAKGGMSQSDRGDLTRPISRFHFLYRKRKWNPSQKCYMGWERKRGLICDFNIFLTDRKDNFRVNTIAEGEIPDIQYVITLDSDTNLVLGSAAELIGAAAHILNKPVTDASKNTVIEGYGIIQPRVGIDLVSSRKSLFTKIYGGLGGTNLYENAVSDVYQDNFDEGIFTGKGIYNLKVFNEVLNNRIPENTVLSHDLLEGNYLRCRPCN